MRSLDQAGDIGDHEAAEIVELHHSELRLERGERIVGYLRTRGREPGDERGFPSVGVSDQADIGQQLQLQPQAALFAGTAGLMFRRRLVRGGGETGVAAAAPASVCYQEPLAGRGEVVELLSALGVVDHRADRRLELDRLPLVPAAVAALAMASALGFMLGVETEMQKGVLVLSGDQINVPAAASIAAARTAARNIFFPPESQTAISAVSGFYVDPDFVDEHCRKDFGCRI